MPRNQREVAMERVKKEHHAYLSAKRKLSQHSEARSRAIVAAVAAGNPKTKVAMVAETSQSRVFQICQENPPQQAAS